MLKKIIADLYLLSIHPETTLISIAQFLFYENMFVALDEFDLSSDCGKYTAIINSREKCFNVGYY